MKERFSSYFAVSFSILISMNIAHRTVLLFEMKGSHRFGIENAQMDTGKNSGHDKNLSEVENGRDTPLENSNEPISNVR